MKEEATITFYKINRCGYYKRAKAKPEFGQIGEVLSNLVEWVKVDGKVLEDTCPYEIVTSASDLRTFCFDIANQSSDYLLTTWNESAAFDGKTASVTGSSKVGEAEVSFQDVPKGSIPGYATYFWFVPEKNAVASVRFNRPLNGHRQMNKFLHQFMVRHSKFVVRKATDDGNVEVIGYRRSDQDELLDHLFVGFESLPHRKKGQIDYIKGRQAEIRKIVKSTLLSSGSDSATTWWQGALNWIGLRENLPDPSDVHVRQEISYTPTKHELSKIIDEWESNYVKDDCVSSMDEVGFVLKGENVPRWLSHAFAKCTIALDIERENDEVVNAASLMNALTSDRSKLLALLEEA